MKTDPLPGNPFATEDAIYTEDANNSSVVNATLALAFEQRTANLIALYTAEGPLPDINYGYIGTQINARLGLEKGN